MQFRLSLALAFLTVTTLPAQQSASRHSIPVADLLAPLIQENWLGPVLLQQRLYEGDDEARGLSALTFLGDRYDVGEAKVLAPGILESLVTQVTSREGTKTRCHISNGRVSFASDEAGLLRAQALLADLRGRLAAPISVEVALYRSQQPMAAGLEWLSVDDAEKRLDAFRKGSHPGQILHQRARFQSGDRLYLGEQRKRNYLSHHYVEIAQDAASIEPKPTTLRYGQGMTLVAEARADGQGVLLHFEIGLKQVPAQVGVIKVGTKYIDELDRVEYETQRFMGSVAAPNRGAFVLAPGGSADQSLRALVVVQRKVTPPPALGRFLLFPSSQLTSSIATLHAPGLETMLPRPLHQKALLAELLSARQESDAHTRSIKTDSSFVLLQGQPDSLRPVLAHANRISAQRSRNYLVKITEEIQGADGTWTRTGVRVALPTLAYQSSAAVLGKGQTFLAGFNAQVAQKAEILSPQMQHFFDGTVLHVSTLPVGDRVLVQVDLESHVLDEMRIIKMTGKQRATIEAPTSRSVRLTRRVDLALGDKRTLGAGPSVTIDGKQRRTRITLQVDAVPNPRAANSGR